MMNDSRIVRAGTVFGLGLGLLVAAAPTALAQDVVEGTWSSERHGDSGPHLRLDGRRDHSTSLHLDREERRDWDRARDAGRDFVLVREAGMLTVFVDRPGDRSGDFQLDVAAGYQERMADLGFPMRGDERLLAAAVLDIGPSWVAEMERAGLQVDTDELFATRIFGVDAEFVRDMEDAGMGGLGADRYVAFRIHGVTRSWLEELRDEGLDPGDADDAIAFRIHGVSAEWAVGIRRGLVGDVDQDDLVGMRIHGVSPEFVEEMATLGIELDGNDAIALRIHGVDPEDVRELQDLGLEDLTADDLIEFRIHGLDRRLERRRSGRG